MYVPLCGEGLRDESYPTPPTRRPYRRSGPPTTGGTRLYKRLCGEQLDVQTCMVPPRGIPIPQTAQAAREGLGCFRRCVLGGWKVNPARPPHGPPISPIRPRTANRDSVPSALFLQPLEAGWTNIQPTTIFMLLQFFLNYIKQVSHTNLVLRYLVL